MIDLPPTPYVIVCNVGESLAWVALGTREHPPTATTDDVVVPPHGWMSFQRGKNVFVDFSGSPIEVRGAIPVPQRAF
jgi:hypothetical protein